MDATGSSSWNTVSSPFPEAHDFDQVGRRDRVRSLGDLVEGRFGCVLRAMERDRKPANSVQRGIHGSVVAQVHGVDVVLAKPTGEPRQILPPIETRVDEPAPRVLGPPDRLIEVRQVVRMRAQRSTGQAGQKNGKHRGGDFRCTAEHGGAEFRRQDPPRENEERGKNRKKMTVSDVQRTPDRGSEVEADEHQEHELFTPRSDPDERHQHDHQEKQRGNRCLDREGDGKVLAPPVHSVLPVQVAPVASFVDMSQRPTKSMNIVRSRNVPGVQEAPDSVRTGFARRGLGAFARRIRRSGADPPDLETMDCPYDEKRDDVGGGEGQRRARERSAVAPADSKERREQRQHGHDEDRRKLREQREPQLRPRVRPRARSPGLAPSGTARSARAKWPA